MEVNIYIGFWTLTTKCTQYRLYGQAAFKNPRVRPRSRAQGRVMPRSGFFNTAPARHPDKCNARRGFLERPVKSRLIGLFGVTNVYLLSIQLQTMADTAQM